MDNVTIEGPCNAAFSCSSFTKKDNGTRNGGLHKHYELFASGFASNVSINGRGGIGDPVGCHFLNQPPPRPHPPPVPTVDCTVTRQLGCFNVTTLHVLPASAPNYHDHVTLENCAVSVLGFIVQTIANIMLRDSELTICTTAGTLSFETHGSCRSRGRKPLLVWQGPRFIDASIHSRKASDVRVPCGYVQEDTTQPMCV